MDAIETMGIVLLISIIIFTIINVYMCLSTRRDVKSMGELIKIKESLGNSMEKKGRALQTPAGNYIIEETETKRKAIYADDIPEGEK